MSAPLLSIITPAFNCKDTIKETYFSIKNQSFVFWEWIIVEDRSTDDTFDFISEMISDDERVTLLRTERNSGAAVARNLGIEKARGRYMAFLDADDLWKEDKLSEQIKFMQDNDYSFTFTNYDLLYPNGKTKHYRIKHSAIDYKKLLKSNSIGCLTVIYDTEKLGKIYMPLDCEKREDHGAWLDIVRTGVCAYRLDKFLSIYRINDKSVSSNKMRMLKYQYRLYRKHENFGVLKSTFYVLLCSIHKLFKKY